MDAKDSHYGPMKHILRLPRTGQQYKLVSSTAQPSQTPTQRPLQLSERQQSTLLAEVEVMPPSNWAQLWEAVKPANKPPLADAPSVKAALAELLKSQQLRWLSHNPTEELKKAKGTRGSQPIQGKLEKAAYGGTHSGQSVDSAAPEAGDAGGDDATPVGKSPAKDGTPPVKECATEGEPISMISGEELLQLTDARLPGPMPLDWTRTYRSSQCQDVGLGAGWTHTGCETLTLSEDQAYYRDADGRDISLPLPEIKQTSRHWSEGLALERVSETGFLLRQEGQWTKRFAARAAHRDTLLLVQLQHPAYRPEKVVLGEREPERGFAINLRYSAAGRLQAFEGNWGKSLELTRDASHRVTGLALVDGASGRQKTLAQYRYSEEGDLIVHRNAAGAEERYQYSNHLIRERQLKSGFRFFFEWDGDAPGARCTRQWGERGIYDYRFEWDPDHKCSRATDSRGHTREYTYNDYGQVVTETDPEGGRHQYAYDQGRKTAYTDPEGRTTRYFYDEDKRPAGLEDALGQRVSLGYFNNRPTRFKDKNGHLWTRRYDQRGLLTELKDPFGLATHYRYNRMGLLTDVRDPSGNRTQYQWSPAGELLSVTDPDGHQRRLHHNDWGQLVQVDIRLKGRIKAGSIRFSYTDTGQLSRVVSANGDTHSYEYNNSDQLTRYSDPRGRVTEFKYDGLSQVVERIDPEGHRLQYEYDNERNLTALINENGERYEFVYDGNERLIKEIGFDGRVQHYQYNAAGHLTQHLDAGEVLTRFERDPLGRLQTLSRRQIGSDEVQEQTRFAYDPAGQLTEAYNEHQYLKFDYNPYGKVTKEHHCDLNGKRERLLSTAQDIDFRYIWPGLRSGMTLPGGDVINYRFDQQLRWTGASFNDQVLADIERDPLGREQARHQGGLTTYSDYDPAGRLLRQHSERRDQKHPGPIQREYGYDAFGNLSQLTDGPDQQRFVYDLLDRLKRVEGTFEEQFHFDPAGNLLGKHGTAQGNRLTLQGDRKYTYDARGNLIEERRGKGGKLVTQYHYNLANQLVKVERNGQCTEYRYDPLGRRIAKRSEAQETRFLWAADQMVRETSGEHTRTYVYEPESFRPLAMVQNEQIYHYHLDHLGTPRELTSDTGDIVWKARYRTYGNAAIQAVDDIDNPIRFQGQYFDEETGLHYNRHRYYNPETGQFTTQDPIGLLGGVNNYQYAPNPTQWVDPLGLSCKEDKYKSTPLLSEYEGENNPNNPQRWNAPMVCDYFNGRQLEKHELDVKDGLLVEKATGLPFDTADSNTHWGDAIFIMDPQGRIFASKTQIPFELHHSSLSQGQPVSAAGEINVAHGRLLTSSNKSGHYAPSNTLNNQFFEELESRGMSSRELDEVERGGWKEDGTPMKPVKHKSFKEAESWSPGDKIPYDWDEF